MELVTASNPWLVATKNMSGGETKEILKFEKGDWVLGQEKEDLPHGSLLAANMSGVEWGWVRWHDSKPTDRRMGLLAEGFQVESRGTLPDQDRQLWDVDEKGQPRDPWQKMIEIPVREADGQQREMLLSGGSKGWEGCCRALFESYGKGLKEGRQGTPILKLSSSHYDHKKYGRVKVPVLELAEWRSEAELAKPKKKTTTKF